MLSMNKRQKRLCRALLDYYDANGAKPYPLAQLAKKTGCDASDIYDKDSQSGDLWPFDAKARGNYAGMLTFSPGKNSTVSITSMGLIELEKLCGDDSDAAVTMPPVEIRKRSAGSGSASPVPAPASPVPAPAAFDPEPDPVPAPAPQFFPVAAAAPAPKAQPSAKQFTMEDVTNARLEFTLWLHGDPAGQALLERLEGQPLIEAALEKFFAEFLKGKDA